LMSFGCKKIFERLTYLFRSHHKFYHLLI
jgi:hypothetical protein